jgi:hypothetical protein
MLVIATRSRAVAQWSGDGVSADSNEITVVVVLWRFLVYAKKRYAGRKELAHYRVVIRAIRRLFGRTRAIAFGPRRLKQYRQGLKTRT